MDLPNNFNSTTKKVMIDLNNQINSNHMRKYNVNQKSLSPGTSKSKIHKHESITEKMAKDMLK